MILNKLQEALEEVESQRAALNEVEADLRAMIAKLSGNVPVLIQKTPLAKPTGADRVPSRDRIDDIIEILRAEGKPLHIEVIAERLSALTGSEVVRTKIEPGLNRHVATAKQKRVSKVGPSTFGLPEWKTEQVA